MKPIIKLILILFTICFQTSIAQFIDQHLVLVIIDGARYSETLGDTTKQYTPRMHQLALQGAVIDTFLNDSLTYTSRAIPAIWCGSWKAPRDTIINGNSTQYTTVPTFWEYFRKDKNQNSLNALYITKYFTAPWLPSYHPSYGPAYWPAHIMNDTTWTDLYVWRLARNALETYHPKFSVIYLADVDAAGHSGNWQNYIRKIQIADSIVGMLWDFIQSDSIFKNRTTLFVTNDHGRHLDTVSSGFVSHGDGCWGCRRIQLLAIGSTIKKGISNIKRNIPDLTPTFGKILDFNALYSTGAKMNEILKPIITIDKKLIDFGTIYINSTIIDSFKIYNSGANNLIININPTVYTSINPNNFQIPQHNLQNVTIYFTPSDTGEVDTFLIINHNDEHQTDTIFIKAKVVKGLDNYTVDVRKNWNLVSLPLKTQQYHIDSIFINRSSSAFGYLNGYLLTDSIVFGAGYWIKFKDSTSINIKGELVLQDTINVFAGWNLIGMISKPIPITNIQTIPENLVSSKIYSYNQSYIPVDTLYPGKAYWIKINSNGKIILK